MSGLHFEDRRGHVCPPSQATHPKDRWESLFVYGFICKFTRLRGKVDGLDSPVDFEDALLAPEANPIMIQVLSQFIRNLRPHTRNLSSDVISSTLASVLADYLKTSERTVFWSDELRKNLDPFADTNGEFFSLNWDHKLKILRTLVELQLCHSPDIKGAIDRAWGVSHNKHKKKEEIPTAPDPADPMSRENLQLVPLGLDCQRKRFWVADDSPRIYTSTNPWKVSATFQTIASTRDEYVATIESLKAALPSSAEGKKKSKLEAQHDALIQALENRLEAIDAGIARVNKSRKKMERNLLLLAQAELRETRTRRQTRRPDYVYNDEPDTEEDADEYHPQEDEDETFIDDEDYLNFRTNGVNGTRRASTAHQRRSSRAASNGKRTAPEKGSEWRGERRSSRLGTAPDPQWDDVPAKRARTEESTVSANSADTRSNGASHGDSEQSKPKKDGAAAVKPTEIALEQMPGKKKSRFWYYAVEPIPGAAPPPAAPDNRPGNGIQVVSNENGLLNNGNSGGNGHSALKAEDGMDIDDHLENGLSSSSSVHS